MGNGNGQIDNYLVTWRKQRESEHKMTLPFVGYERDTYIIRAAFPRFGTGEGKCVINESVRGFDIFILCDPFNYGVEYKMYGRYVPMSPDDHFSNLKRAISAIAGKDGNSIVSNAVANYNYNNSQTTHEIGFKPIEIPQSQAIEKTIEVNINIDQMGMGTTKEEVRKLMKMIEQEIRIHGKKW